MATRSAEKRNKAVKQEKEDDKVVEETKEESTSKSDLLNKALTKALEEAEAEAEKEDEDEEDEEEEEEKSSEEEEKEVPVKKTKVKIEKEDSPAVKQATKQPKPSQQASYIMKLFDRSVNLAKFTEETPLYPLCRAWMNNAPRMMTIKTEKAPDPVPQAEEGDVVEMPKVRIRKGGKPLLQRKDVKINKKDFDKVIDSEIWRKEKLLEFHSKNWTSEREKQIENSKNFDEKHFAANFELIESLIKDSEE